jgi:GntR family transcriptional regulator of arabinose operon
MKQNTLYKTVFDYIVDGIRKGIYKSNTQIPTEMELVDLFKVSRPTVNKALNELNKQGVIYRIPGKGSFVSEVDDSKRKKQILGILALIMPVDEKNLSNTYEFEIMRGVESYLKEFEYFLTLHFSEQNTNKEKDLIKKCVENNIDGIILHPSLDSQNDVLFSELFINKYPIVLLDRTTNGVPLTCVQSDNVNGVYEATKYMIECGYEDLFFVSHVGISTISSVRDRFIGFHKALNEYSIPFEDKKYITISNDISLSSIVTYDNLIPMHKNTTFKNNPDVFRRIVKNILETRDGGRCGIVAVNDEIAFSLLSALMEIDAKIPEDFGIVGFGGSNMPNSLLTTIKQNYFELGRTAARTVIEKIEGKDIQTDTINVAVELIKRKTTTTIHELEVKNKGA